MNEFKTESEAIDWLVQSVDDPCVDNERFAYQDDSVAIAEYESQKENGCCGSKDVVVMVQGKEALVGCNFGH